MTEDSGVTFDRTPSEADVAFLGDQINEFNIRTTGIPFRGPVAAFVRDDEGAIIAGISGFVWGGCLKIQLLWVHEDLRGQGHGSRLLRAAEVEGQARGARQVLLATHGFQAPDFYRAHGYEVYGYLADFPIGSGQYCLRKTLG
jgi:ribosomal protein S18 acetylase RimI-like enzyme